MSEGHVAAGPWQGAAAGEGHGDYSRARAASQASDPIHRLATCLDAAAGCCRPATLDGLNPVRVRLVPGGYVLERRP